MIWGGNGWLGGLGKIVGLSKLRNRGQIQFCFNGSGHLFHEYDIQKNSNVICVERKEFFEVILSISIKGKFYLWEYMSMGALYSEASFVLWAGLLPGNFAYPGGSFCCFGWGCYEQWCKSYWNLRMILVRLMVLLAFVLVL